MLHAMKMMKDNWIGHILLRKCLMKHVDKGNMEGRMEIRRRL